MSNLVKNYNRKKISFSRGKGSYLYSTDGKKNLDFEIIIETAAGLEAEVAVICFFLSCCVSERQREPEGVHV